MPIANEGPSGVRFQMKWITNFISTQLHDELIPKFWSFVKTLVVQLLFAAYTIVTDCRIGLDPFRIPLVILPKFS